MTFRLWIGAAAALAASGALAANKVKKETPSALDIYIQESLAAANPAVPLASGSIWGQNAALGNMFSDLRARSVNDLVTIVVSEKASAVASGTVKSDRKSSAKYSVGALGGVTKATGPLANLASVNGASSLEGAATTGRETVLTTSLSARVTHVLPNGYLVLEGSKEIQVNSEKQLVTVRGVARPTDLTPANAVQSDRLAQLEVRIQGKGVVGDAVRRPFFLYRLLLGLLPF